MSRNLDARWYTRAEILSVLRHPIGGKFGSAEYRKLADRAGEGTSQTNSDSTLPEKPEDPPFRLPPATAIAGVLIRDWAEGKIAFEHQHGSNDIVQKGNL